MQRQRMLDRDALRDEALRLHRRYVEEVVEAFGFCPWSAPARRAGRVRSSVIFGARAELAATLSELARLCDDPEVEIAFLLYPELALARVEFQHFAARVREACDARARAAFAIADFHPEAELDFSSGARMVPFVRRSPDPTLQIVRHSALENARRGASSGTRFLDSNALHELSLASLVEREQPALHARLADENLETIRRRGAEAVQALSDAILDDRDESYARCGLPRSPWRGGFARELKNGGI